MEGDPFSSGFCPLSCHSFKRTNEFRSAVGITGIVEYIRTKIDGSRSHDLRMCCRNREKDEIPPRHIGDRNALATLFACSVLGHGRWPGERRPAHGVKVQVDHQMIRYAQGGCNLPGSLYLHCMALAVGNREEKKLTTLLLGYGCSDGRIQPSARQDDRSMTRWPYHTHSHIRRRLPSVVIEREPRLISKGQNHS